MHTSCRVDVWVLRVHDVVGQVTFTIEDGDELRHALGVGARAAHE